MGTTNPKRKLGRIGSSTKASEYAIVHSMEGAYKWKDGKMLLASGCHAQAGISILLRHGIEFEITKTCKNGVRIGNVPQHRNKHKRIGNNQTWFPADWTDKEIREAQEHVTSLPGNQNIPDGVTMRRKYKNVYVGVKKTNGIVATIFPLKDQGEYND